MLQSSAPELLVVPHPVADVFERLGVETVQALAADAPLAHESRAPEDAELLRDSRQRHVERLRQREHRLLAVTEAIEDRAPVGWAIARKTSARACSGVTRDS